MIWHVRKLLILIEMNCVLALKNHRLARVGVIKYVIIIAREAPILSCIVPSLHLIKELFKALEKFSYLLFKN